MKKKIKIKFVDFWEKWNPEDNFITNTLRKKFDVIISDDPDYIIYSNFNRYFDHIKYQECIKIFYTQENLCPDFNFADYGIGFENIHFGDRYLKFPICFVPERYEKSWKKMLVKHKSVEIETASDRAFCSFVVSNGKADIIRQQFFEKLCKYKKVDSGGKYMNNIGIPEGVPDKLLFEQQHKFSLCFENSRQPGYMTEKIVEAFAAGTVPIYWGDPLVANMFNEDSFIDVGIFASLDEAMDYIIAIDQDDERYKKMLLTPALKSQNQEIWEEKQEELEQYLYNIFSQEKEDAFRRNRVFWGKIYSNWYVEKIREYAILHNNWLNRAYRKVVVFLKPIVKKVLRNRFM